MTITEHPDHLTREVIQATARSSARSSTTSTTSLSSSSGRLPAPAPWSASIAAPRPSTMPPLASSPTPKATNSSIS